jgi:hypothetical protein
MLLGRILGRAGVDVEVFAFRGSKKVLNYLMAWHDDLVCGTRALWMYTREWSRMFLSRLKKDAKWPPWIPVKESPPKPPWARRDFGRTGEVPLGGPGTVFLLPFHSEGSYWPPVTTNLPPA